MALDSFLNTDFFIITASVNALWFQNDSQKAKVYLGNLPDFEIEMNMAEFRSYFSFRHTAATN